jgi:two-component system copper resistance phosphate regulon response regulator CusR
MRILVLEDDKTLRGYIHQALTQQGYSVDQASTGKEAAQMASEHTYDLFLLDVRMPGQEDGNWVLRSLRQNGHRAAIIMLTGQGGEEDKIISFKAGADDYITKPFNLTELFARVAVWRNRYREFLASSVSSTELTAGDLRLNAWKRHAIRGEKKIPLTHAEFKIIQCLLENKGQIVTQSQLSEVILERQVEHTSNAVEVAIKRLRDKLDEGYPDSIIKTLRGSGYMIEDDEK